MKLVPCQTEQLFPPKNDKNTSNSVQDTEQVTGHEVV